MGEKVPVTTRLSTAEIEKEKLDKDLLVEDNKLLTPSVNIIKKEKEIENTTQKGNEEWSKQVLVVKKVEQ